MDATTLHSVFPSSKADWRRALRLVTPSFRLRDERKADVPAREVLLDAAFGPARFTKTCEQLRRGRSPAEGLSFVAIEGSDVVGTVRLWDVEIGRQPGLMLGPLAVSNKKRSSGIGGALMEHALRRARKLGHERVFLVGDAPYYARFGFDAAPMTGCTLPGPVDRERFLGLELVPDALTGTRGRIVAAGAMTDSRIEAGSRLAA